jgi:hypothetical protein
MPVVFLCNNQSAYEKIVSNVQEVRFFFVPQTLYYKLVVKIN